MHFSTAKQADFLLKFHFPLRIKGCRGLAAEAQRPLQTDTVSAELLAKALYDEAAQAKGWMQLTYAWDFACTWISPLLTSMISFTGVSSSTGACLRPTRYPLTFSYSNMHITHSAEKLVVTFPLQLPLADEVRSALLPRQGSRPDVFFQ